MAGPNRPAEIGAETRRQALIRSFWLVRDAQGDAEGASAAIGRLLELADRRRWPEVVLAGLYAGCVLARESDDGSLPGAIERLRRQAEADADPAMVALALALRARAAAQSRESTRWVTVDADLVRATVMLESGQ